MTGPDTTDGSERRITESLPAERFLAELRADRDRFAALGLLASEEHTAPIAACPGWDLATLVLHLGRIHRWPAEQVLLEPSATDTSAPPRPAPDTPLTPCPVARPDRTSGANQRQTSREPTWINRPSSKKRKEPPRSERLCL